MCFTGGVEFLYYFIPHRLATVMRRDFVGDIPVTVLGLNSIQYHGTRIGQCITVLGLDSIQYHGTGLE